MGIYLYMLYIYVWISYLIDNFILFACLLVRFKHNVTIREINQAVVKALLESVLEDKSLTKQSMVQELDKVVNIF